MTATETLDQPESDRTQSAPAALRVERRGGDIACRGSGDWTMEHIHRIDDDLRNMPLDGVRALVLDTSDVTAMDTSGAWVIERTRRMAQAANVAFRHADDDARHNRLIGELENEATGPAQAKPAPRNPIAIFGGGVRQAWEDLITAFYLVGSAIRGPQAKSGHRGGLRIKAIIHQIEQMGLLAVPVVCVMTFLIGMIIAQQGAFQLKFYGEELLTVSLVAILLLREIGVLLTAVMVAGRTGSAITAELGSMKMREEIDALQVIGLNPVGVLILPRLLALIIVMPVLVLLANIAGLLGAMLVSAVYIDISPEQFVTALRSDVELKHLFAGMLKAPFMALIIGLIAAVEGLKVGGSAESLGRRTTASVVRSIFVVIVVDGLFAIFFTAIGI